MRWISTVIVLTLLIFLSGVSALVSIYTYRLSERIREQIEVRVLLQPGLPDSTVQRLREMWRQMPSVVDFTVISPEEGLRNLQMDWELPEGGWTGSPEPLRGYIFYVFRFRLKGSWVHEDSLERLRRQWEAMPEVMRVLYPRETVRVLNWFFGKGIWILMGAVGLLLGLSWLTIRNFVRLSLYERRFLIKNMQAVGASWWFIFRPYVGQVLQQTGVALLLGGALLAGFLYLLVRVEWLSWEEIFEDPLLWVAGGMILLVVLVVPVATTFVTILRFLRRRMEELYEMT